MTAVGQVALLDGAPVVGMQVGPLSMVLSLQRLIMVSGANRDFAMAHIDNESARKGGAPAAYADIMFVFTMIERLLLEWAGPAAVLRKMGPVKLHDFVVSGADVAVAGVVSSVAPRLLPGGRPGSDVDVAIHFMQGTRQPVSGSARVWIPAPPTPG